MDEADKGQLMTTIDVSAPDKIHRAVKWLCVCVCACACVTGHHENSLQTLTAHDSCENKHYDLYTHILPMK